MSARQHRITDMIMQDPDVKEVSVRLGSSRQGASASFNIQLKTRAEGRRDTTAQVTARLTAKASEYPDLELRLRSVQDLGGRGMGGQGALYQVSLQSNELDQLQ